MALVTDLITALSMGFGIAGLWRRGYKITAYPFYLLLVWWGLNYYKNSVSSAPDFQ